MPVYKFTASAYADLNHIIDYTLQTWGESQATKYINGLEKLAQILAETPKLGKYCHQLHEGLLAFPYESHVVYYLVQSHGITIARVLHKNMNPNLHFTGDKRK